MLESSFLNITQGLARFARVITWRLLEHVLRIVAAIFIGALVARHLGVVDFGVLSYGIALVGIFSGLAKLGLDSIVARDLVERLDSADMILGTTFWLKIASSVIVIMLISMIAYFLGLHADKRWIIFIISIGVFFQSFEVIDFYFLSITQARIVSIAKILQLVISSALKIYFIINKGDLQVFVNLVFFDGFFLAFSYIVAHLIFKASPRLYFYNKFSLRCAKNLLSESYLLLLTTLAVGIYMGIDQIMIESYMDFSSVGVYAVAVKLSIGVYFIPILVMSSVFPAIINARKKSAQVYRDRLLLAYSIMFWIATFGAVFVFFAADMIVDFIFGSEYTEASDILRMHILAAIPVFMGSVFGRYLIVEGFLKHTLHRALAGCVINIVLNYLLIPVYGIFGAALATVISQFFVTYIYGLIFLELRNQVKLQCESIILPFVLGYNKFIKV